MNAEEARKLSNKSEYEKIQKRITDKCLNDEYELILNYCISLDTKALLESEGYIVKILEIKGLYHTQTIINW
jgi:hypothetical protein